MMTLRTIGALYLLSGLWCVTNPEASSQFLGMALSQQGLAEFIAVYGGLQVGIAIAMIGSTFNPQFVPGALYFALLVSVGLFVFRLLGIALHGAYEGLLMMAVLEGVFVLALLKSYLKRRNTSL